MEPTGWVDRATGQDVFVMSRTVSASIEETWNHLINPDRTALWVGRWTGEGKPGSTVMVAMTEEEGSEPQPLTISSCDPPLRLGVSMGGWPVSVQLVSAGSGTTVELRHELGAEDDIGDVGPGWEFYMDRFVAALSGGVMHAWDYYYPTMKEPYEALKHD